MERAKIRKYDPAHVVSGDGVRPWHIQTISRDLPDGSGFRLWIGNAAIRHHTEERINSRTLNQVEAIMAPAGFFTPPEVITHQPPCGRFWLGLSRDPLPANWERITARWPGWTHIVHWTDQPDEMAIPQPEEMFDYAYALLSQEGYPENLWQFTQSLIAVSGVGLESSRNLRIFPYTQTN